MFKRWLLGGIVILSLFSQNLLAISIMEQKFPSANYVLKSFDIEPSYLNSSDFINFVLNNEYKYRRFYQNSLKRGKKYVPLFRELLTSGGLSHLFLYMSMTESGFKSYAVSSKKAVGLWQFMSATAKRFKLQVDDKKDERYDPVASTKAAMEYIQTLYRMFGKWYLVMMAYNCGEGRLQRAIKRAQSDDFLVLMNERANYIPKETRDYLRKIILLSMIGEKIHKGKEKEYKKIREKILPKGEVLVNLYGGTSLSDMAKILRVDLKELKKLNPQIPDGKISTDLGMTQIFIPAKKLPYYKALYHPPLLKDIYKKKGYKKLIAHIVKKNDTLKSIARAYHATPLDLIVANQLSSSNLRVGEILMVPVTEDTYEKRLHF